MAACLRRQGALAYNKMAIKGLGQGKRFAWPGQGCSGAKWLEPPGTLSALAHDAAHWLPSLWHGLHGLLHCACTAYG